MLRLLINVIFVILKLSSLGAAGLNEDGQQMQQLADACLVIDALDPSAKEELIRNVCSKELTAYQQIFQGTGTFSTCVHRTSTFYCDYWYMTSSCIQIQCITPLVKYNDRPP